MDAKIISVLILACFLQLAASSLGESSDPNEATCGENEWTNGCGSSCEETCDNPFISCIDICSGNLCRCIEGHVRHEGKCIPLESCPQKECPVNAVWDFCGQFCPPTCEQPDPICPGICTQSSCICTESHVKDAEGNCIKKEDCPSNQKTE